MSLQHREAPRRNPFDQPTATDEFKTWWESPAGQRTHWRKISLAALVVVEAALDACAAAGLEDTDVLRIALNESRRLVINRRWTKNATLARDDLHRLIIPPSGTSPWWYAHVLTWNAMLIATSVSTGRPIAANSLRNEVGSNVKNTLRNAVDVWRTLGDPKGAAEHRVAHIFFGEIEKKRAARTPVARQNPTKKTLPMSRLPARRKKAPKKRRETHRIVQNCVMAVAKKRPLRAAFAICVSQQQKLGRMVPGSLKLTRKGRRVELDLARRRDAKRRVAAFERLLRSARRATVARPRNNPSKVNTYLIQFRPADGGVYDWQTIDTATSKARGVEGMLSAEGLRELRQGDLVRLTDEYEGNEALAVMTQARGLVKAPTMPRILAKDDPWWVEAWEGGYSNAEHMVTAAKRMGVEWSRIVGACAGCARSAFQRSPARRSERAVETVEAWLGGERETLLKLEEAYAGASAEAWRDPMGTSFPATLTIGLLLPYGRKEPEKVMVAAATSLARQTERWPFRDEAGVRRATENSLHSLAFVVRRSLPLSAVLLAGLGETLPFRYVRQNPGRC